MKLKCAAAVLLAVLFAGCTDSPGQLEGTWKADTIPMTITFRPGETETLGIIERVNYATNGNVVKVTYKDGLMKGSSINYVMQDQNTATNQMYTLRRIR
jgi:hypothetical protein